MHAMVRSIDKGRPLVYGHRGARAYAPMNTLPSFALAIELGADGIELDVQLSADGEIVVIHDFTVDDSTDGQGSVADLLFAEIREFDASARFVATATPLNGMVPGPFKGIRIPTLEEVFALVRDTTGEDFIVNVELKAPYCERDGSEAAPPTGLEAAVADRIKRYGMADRVLVSSFNPPTLARFRKLAPQIPIAFLCGTSAPIDTTSFMRDTPYDAWHPSRALAGETSISGERALGRFVNIWTVNDEAEAARFARDGASGIITDVSDRILRALSR